MRALCLSVLIVLQACSVRLPSSIVSSFDRCNLPDVEKYFHSELKDSGKDQVLYRYGLLSTQMREGKRKEAIQNALVSQQLIWGESGKGRGVASLASAESLKLFKGEPFERAMNSLYLGILLTQDGDYDNARAAFSKARLAVAQNSSTKKSYSAVAEYLFARLLAADNQMDNARIAIANAQQKYPSNPVFSDQGLGYNVVFVLESGRVPQKYRTGPGDSLTAWRQQRWSARTPQVVVDQKSLEAYEAENLYQLAMSKESSAKDTIQGAKGVARELGAITTVIAADQASRRHSETAGWVALGAGLFTVLNQSQADIRQWEFLPEKLFVAGLKLEPGLHTFQMGDQRSWSYVVQDPSKPVIFWIPSDMCMSTSLWEQSKEIQ